MTVAIAALVDKRTIVTVSDARLSYNEAIPAADGATLKSKRIAKRWAIMFAAEDATAFTPVVVELQQKLANGAKTLDLSPDYSFTDITKAAQTAYENEYSERFFRTHLSRFKYADIVDFRKHGFDELGRDLYHQYATELARFDLGLEMIGYGFDGKENAFVFEVANPGKIISHSLRRYVTIGSGSLMAMAAMNRKSLPTKVEPAIYRILDAKFSSETARDVGKKTYVISMTSDGIFKTLPETAIEEIREIWLEEQARSEPSDALDVIEKSLKGL